MEGVGRKDDFKYLLKCTISAMLICPAIAHMLQENLCSKNIPLGLIRLVAVVVLICALGYFETGQVIFVRERNICLSCRARSVGARKRALESNDILGTDSLVERYLIGRQLCVIAIVFVVATLMAPAPISSQLMIPNCLRWMFVFSGLCGALVTMVFGQMYPQLMGEEFSVRYLDRPGSVMFVRMALYVEMAGVLTSFSHVVCDVMAHTIPIANPLMRSTRSTCDDIVADLNTQGDFCMVALTTLAESDTCDTDPPTSLILPFFDINFPQMNGLEHLTSAQAEDVMGCYVGDELERSETLLTELTIECCYCQQLLPPCSYPTPNDDKTAPNQQHQSKSCDTYKCIVSGVLTCGAGCVVLIGIWCNSTDFSPEAAHPVYSRWIKTTMLLTLMACIFLLEGMQVAVLAGSTLHLNEVPVRFTRAAKVLASLTSRTIDSKTDEGDIIKRFLIGRQLLVVCCMFGVAAVNSSGTGISYQNRDITLLHAVWIAIVRSGIASVVLVLNTVQLPPQLFGKKFPLSFLNIPGCYLMFKASLVVEASGVCHLGWLLFSAMKRKFITAHLQDDIIIRPEETKSSDVSADI